MFGAWCPVSFFRVSVEGKRHVQEYQMAGYFRQIYKPSPNPYSNFLLFNDSGCQIFTNHLYCNSYTNWILLKHSVSFFWHFSHRYTIDHNRDTVSGNIINQYLLKVDTQRFQTIMIDAQLFLRPQRIPHTERPNMARDHTCTYAFLLKCPLYLLDFYGNWTASTYFSDNPTYF
jgi:hypothetical protein